MPTSQELGPVDYAIIAFPGSRFTGQIAPALADLVDAGTVRIIDLVFIQKADDGTVVVLEVAQLDPEVRAAFEREGIEVEGLFDDSDVEAAAEEIPPGSSALLLVWENLWARRIADATRDSGGELLDFGRLPHEVVQAAHDYAVGAAGEGH
jgi:hypothetical protein